jgi:hypothetical protein
MMVLQADFWPLDAESMWKLELLTCQLQDTSPAAALHKHTTLLLLVLAATYTPTTSDSGKMF